MTARPPKRTAPLKSFLTGPPPTPNRSRIMSRIRGKDTGPEIQLRKAVWKLGGRFRVHSKTIAGRPDMSNASARVAIFVDGCFWHGCPRHFRAPKTRREFWEEKIRRNKVRRSIVLHEL